MRDELIEKLKKMNLKKIYRIRGELSKLHKWESALTIRYTHHCQVKFWKKFKQLK